MKAQAGPTNAIASANHLLNASQGAAREESNAINPRSCISRTKKKQRKIVVSEADLLTRSFFSNSIDQIYILGLSIERFYGLLILFVLLLAGGFGSHLSARIPDDRVRATGIRVLAALTGVLFVAGLATVPLIGLFRDAETAARIAVSGALLAVMGVVMGMAFPLGMRLASASRRELGPWLWGVNGAMSVVASVLAVVIAMAFGISASFWTGVATYAMAVGAFAAAARPRTG